MPTDSRFAVRVSSHRIKSPQGRDERSDYRGDVAFEPSVERIPRSELARRNPQLEAHVAPGRAQTTSDVSHCFVVVLQLALQHSALVAQVAAWSLQLAASARLPSC